METESRAEKVGRTAGLALYFFILIFVISAGALSVFDQVYGFRGSRGVSAAVEKRCASEIRWLKGELLSRTIAIQSDSSQESLKKWSVQWDGRFRALGDNCGKLETARIDLKDLRQKLEAMLLELRYQQARLVKRIERNLDN
jgi:hypothetical protein